MNLLPPFKMFFGDRAGRRFQYPEFLRKWKVLRNIDRQVESQLSQLAPNPLIGQRVFRWNSPPDCFIYLRDMEFQAVGNNSVGLIWQVFVDKKPLLNQFGLNTFGGYGYPVTLRHSFVIPPNALIEVLVSSNEAIGQNYTGPANPAYPASGLFASPEEILADIDRILGGSYGEESADPVMLAELLSYAPGPMANGTTYVWPLNNWPTYNNLNPTFLPDTAEYECELDLALTGGADRTIKADLYLIDPYTPGDHPYVPLYTVPDIPCTQEATPHVERSFSFTTQARNLLPVLAITPMAGVLPLTGFTWSLRQNYKRMIPGSGETIAARVTLNGVRIPEDIYRDIGEDLLEYETVKELTK